MSIKNNLLVSFRHLKADKTNTLINLTGLILGLGIVAVVLVFILNELGYNHSFANRDRIYRIVNQNEDDNNRWANTPFVAGETVADKFAEVEAHVHQYNIGHIEVKSGAEYIEEKNVLCTETSFFGVFGVNIIQGTLSGFDQAKGKIVLGETIARKYFGEENPVGRMFTLRSKGVESQMEVVAVFDDLPMNSTIKASMIANADFGLENLSGNIISVGKKPGIQEMKESWAGGLFFTNYLLLKKGTSVAAFDVKLHQLGAEHSDKDNRLNFSLQPLNDIYFGSEKIVDNNAGDKGNRSMLLILALVGFLILTVACINYLNLT